MHKFRNKCDTQKHFFKFWNHKTFLLKLWWNSSFNCAPYYIYNIGPLYLQFWSPWLEKNLKDPTKEMIRCMRPQDIQDLFIICKGTLFFTEYSVRSSLKVAYSAVYFYSLFLGTPNLFYVHYSTSISFGTYNACSFHICFPLRLKGTVSWDFVLLFQYSGSIRDTLELEGFSHKVISLYSL